MMFQDGVQNDLPNQRLDTTLMKYWGGSGSNTGTNNLITCSSVAYLLFKRKYSWCKIISLSTSSTKIQKASDVPWIFSSHWKSGVIVSSTLRVDLKYKHCSQTFALHTWLHCTSFMISICAYFTNIYHTSMTHCSISVKPMIKWQVATCISVHMTNIYRNSLYLINVIFSHTSSTLTVFQYNWQLFTIFRYNLSEAKFLIYILILFTRCNMNLTL